MGLKEQGIVSMLNRLWLPYPDIHFIQGPAGDVGDGFFDLTEDGQPTKSYLTTGELVREIADRREDGYSGLGTPMFHFVEGDTYDEHFFANFFESTQELEQTVEENPAMTARMIVTRVFRFYLRESIDAPPKACEKLRASLTPDYEGVFQFHEWQDAFRRPREIEY